MQIYQFIIICLIFVVQTGILFYYLKRIAFLTALSGTCANKIGMDVMEKLGKIEDHTRNIKGR
jgi:hypothetical protein